MFMFCSVSYAARYTHFHSKLVCRLTPPLLPPSLLLPPHCTVGRVRPAAQPPAHPAVICNTIRFAAAVDSPAMLRQGERSGLALALAASNAFFCSFALLPALRADRSCTHEGGDGGVNSSLGIFNLTMRAIYVGISWRAF